MRVKSTKKDKSRSQIIKQDGFANLLRYSPDTKQFDLEERESWYRKAEKVREQNVHVPEEELDVVNLSERAKILFQRYLAYIQDNRVNLSDKEVAQLLKWSLRTVQRYKQELIKRYYINILYNKEKKEYEIEILPPKKRM